MRQKVTGVVIANAAIVGGMVHYAGAELHMTALALVAVAIGSGVGICAANWLEDNGYTMEKINDV